MKRRDAARTLADWDERGRSVWTTADLATLFAGDSARALEASIARLVREELLQRACRGVYVTARSRGGTRHTLEAVAVALRRGHYSYVSLESALSEYGAISQVPMVRTIMTTGRSGRVRTAFGTLELVHTSRSVPSILDGTVDVGRPLRLARARTALEDLRRVGRNLHLVDLDELAEIEADERAA